LVGFDLNIANSNNFTLQNLIFELSESIFSKKYFNDIYTHPSYNKLVNYFDFKNSNQTKLISSRISIYQNTYIEVKFSFYQENYTLYFDDTFKNSYYSTKKPSDQYELDLLSKFLTNITNNDLVTAKTTVQKLSEYKYININEALLAQQISVTEAIYEANDEIKNRNYNTGERVLAGIKDLKGHSDDFRKLKSKLNKIYFKNTSISALFVLSFIIYKLLDKNNQFLFVNATIASVILVTSYFLNYLFRNIHVARFVVLILFSCQIMYIFSEEKQNGSKINSESYIKNKYIHYEIKRAYQDSIFKQMGIFKGSDFLLLEESKNKPKTSENLYLLARIYTKRAFDSILIYKRPEFDQDNYMNNYNAKTGSTISLKPEEFSTKNNLILFNESVNLCDSFINEALKIDPYDDYFIRLKCFNITWAAKSYPLTDSSFVQKIFNDYFDYFVKFYYVLIRDEENPSNQRLLFDIMNSSVYKKNNYIIDHFRSNNVMYENLFRIYYKSIINLEKFYKNSEFWLKELKNDKSFWANDFIRCGVDVN
jgi:hypothetical protein